MFSLEEPVVQTSLLIKKTDIGSKFNMGKSDPNSNGTNQVKL